MEPIAALDEIAFRLERELAPSFKVKAFRRAADALAGIPASTLPEQVRDGSLRRTKGIGNSTFDVINEAISGQVPGYLQKVRDRAEPLLGSQAGAPDDVGSAIRGDLHTHSEWTDGTTPIDKMVDAARWLGREYIALTDHSPNLTIANGLSAARLTDQLYVVAQLNKQHDDIQVLSGIEVDILESGELDQTPEMLDRLNVVVASVHSKLRADEKTMTERMLRGIAHPRTNVLGHCTGRLVKGSRGTRPPSTFDAERVFAACAANDVAIEINSRPERQDPPDDLIRLALDVGCLFSIDSDAHAPGHLDFLSYGAERAQRNGVPIDRIVTTWPVDRLLEWSRAAS
ncbi:PHP domain-containing protein [Saxibacter everestensis]|uniref:PHP domain-containing protein n=1 Tax=Saxibacter everestensis TaxID=2909229 RepID=A0ABY8QWN0_9MICO|nr:PHP domain-containing protein [Brevibacteriaceae bacterium ZFBP1038]